MVGPFITNLTGRLPGGLPATSTGVYVNGNPSGIRNNGGAVGCPFDATAGGLSGIVGVVNGYNTTWAQNLYGNIPHTGTSSGIDPEAYPFSTGRWAPYSGGRPTWSKQWGSGVIDGSYAETIMSAPYKKIIRDHDRSGIWWHGYSGVYMSGNTIIVDREPVVYSGGWSIEDATDVSRTLGPSGADRSSTGTYAPVYGFGGSMWLGGQLQGICGKPCIWIWDGSSWYISSSGQGCTDCGSTGTFGEGGYVGQAAFFPCGSNPC
jgi:hypothetical protein